MNGRFLPGTEAVRHESEQAVPSAAIVTASYAPDFQRCRLLCETVDRFVTGFSKHYLLVEHGDVGRFRALESARRVVVDERDLLPPWLYSMRDPTSLFRRRVWLSARTMPLRGWHVQQLRRIAIAAHAGEEVLVYCDSDVAFLKPFDCGAFARDRQVRLFRREGVIGKDSPAEHVTWSRNAAAVLGIDAPAVWPHDYIATLIAWRRATVVGMCRRIEETTGRHWVAALGARRKFSECMLYGRYVDQVLGGEGHFHGREEFCRIHWNGAPMSDDEFSAFIDGMGPEQVAIGMQSFIGTDLGRIRRILASR
ncbi:DUF6492 family protein [Mesorhizobium sp. 1B3]|uniref:DUF6492 family protein n=1 Tax=Mesorhizobium sp. 1B3 TaxID=3243599 RepID=UPI003D973183